MYLLYSTLLGLALLLASPYWIFQALRHGKYRKGISQRLGILPANLRSQGHHSIWIHAISVGEVLAVSELVRRAVDRHIVNADKSGLRVLQLNIPTALPWPTHEHDEAAHRGFSAGRRGRYAPWARGGAHRHAMN